MKRAFPFVCIALLVGIMSTTAFSQSALLAKSVETTNERGTKTEGIYAVELLPSRLGVIELFSEQGEINTISAPISEAKDFKISVRDPTGSTACELVPTTHELSCTFQAGIGGIYTVSMENRSEQRRKLNLKVVRTAVAVPQASTNATPSRATKPGNALVRVFYATDRKKDVGQRLGKMFGSERGDTQYGYCDVSIPAVHQAGEIERPSVLRFEFNELADRHVMIREIQELASHQFWSALTNVTKREGSAATLVFVHGYNTSFEEAAWRSAQIVYDLRFRGAGVFFSWPSAGSAAAYTVDEANVELSQSRLTKFFEEMARSSEKGNIYVIGHSMGTRALTRALAAAAATSPELKSRVKEIILSAPDIDAAVFKEQIVPALRQFKAPITLYASQNDRALQMSRIVHGADRVGSVTNPAIVLDGVETIVASNVETDFLGHSYFAKDRSMLNDIFDIVNTGVRPDHRFNLQRRNGESGAYWEFKR